MHADVIKNQKLTARMCLPTACIYFLFLWQEANSRTIFHSANCPWQQCPLCVWLILQNEQENLTSTVTKIFRHWQCMMQKSIYVWPRKSRSLRKVIIYMVNRIHIATSRFLKLWKCGGGNEWHKWNWDALGLLSWLSNWEGLFLPQHLHGNTELLGTPGSGDLVPFSGLHRFRNTCGVQACMQAKHPQDEITY